MVTEFYAFEMLTGRRLTPLPATTGTWGIKVNADESITCSVPSRAAVTAKLDVWGSTTLARNGLLAVVGGEPVAAGPIWKRSYSQNGSLTFTAGGLRSYWERRLLLPVAARTQPLVNSDGSPNTALDTTLSGLSYGSIAKRWVELMLLWPGGNVPVMLPPEVAGTRTRTVLAVELKNLRKLLDDLTNVVNGPDIAFRPRWSADGLGIYWEMQVGTEDKPWLGNPDPSLIRWSIGASTGGSAHSLSVSEDATGMREEVFASGGRQSDKVLMSRARLSVLSDQGFPLLQATDTSHSDVVLQSTLDGYAQAGANDGRYVASFWSMKARAKMKGAPVLGEYWVGDLATIDVDKAEPVLPAGPVVRRLAAIGSDIKGDDIDLTFAEALA